MLPLSPSQLVRVWERGAGQPAMLRALVVLAEADAVANTDADADAGSEAEALLDLPLGERDDRLLALRAATFGSRLEALASCPACGERVELRFSAADVSGDSSSSGSADGAVRPLTTRDLLQVSGCKGIAEARRELAERCTGVAMLDDPRIDAVAERLEEIDGAAMRLIESRCPACGAGWTSEFDVAAFLWLEIEAAALRLLADVHTLARAYGWREQDILAMNPQRRRVYLELVS
jgi:uncharacterized protein (UPF0212 family)